MTKPQLGSVNVGPPQRPGLNRKWFKESGPEPSTHHVLYLHYGIGVLRALYTKVHKGTPDRISAECRATIERGKQIKNGFIFMGGCEILANTPPLHACFVDKACQEIGAY